MHYKHDKVRQINLKGSQLAEIEMDFLETSMCLPQIVTQIPRYKRGFKARLNW